MNFQDPIAVYTSDNNGEAHIVAGLLNSADIKAYVLEDFTGGSMSIFVQKPQVWIERADLERAEPLLQEYIGQQSDLADEEVDADDEPEGPPIRVVCEECGQTVEFPASARGRVEECPYCTGLVDVEIDHDFDVGEADPEV